jgi:Peptidase family M28
MVEAFDIGAFAQSGPGRRGPAYYSPAMEAARPGGQRRRARRGTVDRPLNARLVRVAALVVAPALLALLFSISTTGTLPRPPLDPLFDTASAESLANELSVRHPSRIPGSLGADDATVWYRETISGLGLQTEEDVWTADLPDLGEVRLRNVVTVVPGRAEEAIVLVAHRDNAGAGAELGDNASGTAALIELARGYAPQESSPAPRPQRTLVLVSTDAGAYGGAGAARFAKESTLAESAIAAIVLDGLDGSGQPRIALAGNGVKSAPRTLVSTASARIEEQTLARPATPSALTQLVDLGVPYAYGEQAPFLEHGIAAVTLTTDDRGDPNVPAGDRQPGAGGGRLGGMGRSCEAIVASLDASVGAALRTPATLHLDDRAASGWAVRLTLIVAVVPFVLGVLDLLVRARRRRVPLRPAFRGVRTRLLVAFYGALVVWIAAIAGVFPTGEPVPLPPSSASVTDWPIAGAAVTGLVIVAGWLITRRRLAAPVRPTPEERLAGYTAALSWLAAVAIVTALFKPFALLFVLPSLYAWLWLPLRTGFWPRAVVYLLGWIGPVGALLILGNELGLGPADTLLYVIGLATVGYVSLPSIVLGLAWLASAAQLAALAFGRYAPYARGLEPPPAGPVRQAVRRARVRRQTAT